MSKPLTNAEENPHAGQGSSVLLDIGDGVGAVVITMPAELDDAEIERRPVGWSAEVAGGEHGHDPAVGHGADHGHSHDHADHDHGHGHGHGHGSGFPHVAVVPRPAPDGEVIYSAVFFDVPEGTYELHVLPDGPVQLTVEVHSGHVTEADWPT
ncbi:hypothetical protein AB0P21_05225 [Kribbella sp. NPDC056861]|uniref:hypothetical protein n=1 Tax=Kribbella sp. NPDC056861 TaxID=3154857 RepID=UPI0034290D1C